MRMKAPENFPYTNLYCSPILFNFFLIFHDYVYVLKYIIFRFSVRSNRAIEWFF